MWLYFTHLARRPRGQISTTFGYRVAVTDKIICNIFFRDRSRRWNLLEGRKSVVPIDKAWHH